MPYKPDTPALLAFNPAGFSAYILSSCLLATSLDRFGLCVVDRTCPSGAFRSRGPLVVVRDDVDVLFLAHLRLPRDLLAPVALRKPVLRCPGAFL